MNYEQLSDDHKRCAMQTHGKVISRRYDSREDKMIDMLEAIYHVGMATLYQLKEQANHDRL